jgi:hypothetical protein
MGESKGAENKSFSINLTSTAIEKGLDLAKDFLGKLIGPAIEETGLLLKDHATMWRFKNQVKMVVRAKEICEKHNIKPKTISLKLLTPLLEGASLEDDEYLQDKWANLLSNLVDSDQNIQNHVFPYILSQISRNEFKILETLFLENIEIKAKTQHEIDDFLFKKPGIIADIEEKLLKLVPLIDNNPFAADRAEQINLRSALHNELFHVQYTQEHVLKHRMTTTIEVRNLQEFEIANLTRLGLIKEVVETVSNPTSIDVPTNSHSYDDFVKVNVEVDIFTSSANFFTELGMLFIKACQEKQSKGLVITEQ